MASASLVRSSLSLAPTPDILRGSSTFSYADSSGSRPKDWNTKPILCRRSSVSSASLMSVRSRSSNRICPDVGLSSPAIRFSRVVLPEPDLPTTAMNRPGWTVRLTPRSADTSSPSSW